MEDLVLSSGNRRKMSLVHGDGFEVILEHLAKHLIPEPKSLVGVYVS